MLSLIGRQVVLHRPVKEGSGYVRVPTPGTVLGFDPQLEGQSFPNLHIAFLEPKRSERLLGSDWRAAFDRLLSVRHASDEVTADPAVPCYELADQPEMLVRKPAEEPEQKPEPKKKPAPAKPAVQ